MKSWTSSKDAIKSAPGTSPPHLGGRTGRDKYSTCIGKGQTKSDQEGKAFGVTRKEKLLSTPPSRAGRDASGRKMALATFLLSYRWELTIPDPSLLGDP